MGPAEYYLQPGTIAEWLKKAPRGRGRFIEQVQMTEEGVSSKLAFICNPRIEGSGAVKPGQIGYTYPGADIYTRIRHFNLDPRFCPGSLTFIGNRIELGEQTLTAWEVYDPAEKDYRDLLMKIAAPSAVAFEFTAMVGDWQGTPKDENFVYTHLGIQQDFKNDIKLFLSAAKGPTFSSRGLGVDEVAERFVLDMGKKFMDDLVGAAI